MNIEIIDYDTYKRLNYDSVFKDYHNDSYRIYGKIVEGNSYAKINCGEVEIYCMDNSFKKCHIGNNSDTKGPHSFKRKLCLIYITQIT